MAEECVARAHAALARVGLSKSYLASIAEWVRTRRN
jgi:hypothetical protein